MNQLDTYAVPDADPAVDTLLAECEARIAAFDGRRLFESGAHDIDAELDALDLPDVFSPEREQPKTWDDMTPDDHARWDALAAAIRMFAEDRLDHERVARVALDI